MKWIKKYFWILIPPCLIAWVVASYSMKQPELSSAQAEPTASGPTEPSSSSRKNLRFRGEKVHSVLPKGAIPAIYKPVFVSAEEAVISSDTPVIGVSDGKEAKAYSHFLLDSHEIVNDFIGGHPIAVTW